MISYAEALNLLQKRGRALGTSFEEENVSLEECNGRILAEKIRASEALPGFDNSAMDGYALRSSDTVAASPCSPVALAISGTIPAGATSAKSESGSVFEIMTGAPIPHGCDAVVRLEDVQKDGANIRLSKPVIVEENIRFSGEDIQRGDELFLPGTRLQSSHLLTLSALGMKALKVCPRPFVAILATGSELVPHTTVSLKGAQIRSSTMPYLESVLRSFGCEVQAYGICRDNPQDLYNHMTNILAERPSIIITTGGVSAGKFDYMRPVLKDLGASILFHKVAIRPGKPILVAELKGVTIFALPGNPVSSAVGFRFFIDPFLRALFGMSMEEGITAQLEKETKSDRRDLTYFLKGKATVTNGRITVEALKGQSSFMVAPLLKANCWMVMEPKAEALGNGNIVKIVPLEGSGIWQ